MSKEIIYNHIPSSEKITVIARACINLPVQRYDKAIDSIFVGDKFNGCVSFVKFVLNGAGIVTPNFIGPDNVQRPMNHVNEFFDHFGVNIPYNKYQAGDILIFSWNGLIPQHIGIVVSETHYIHAHTKDGYVKKNKIYRSPIGGVNEKSIYIENPIGIKRATEPNSDTRWHQKPIE